MNNTIKFDKDDAYLLNYTLERVDTQHLKGRVHISDMLFISFDQVDGTYVVCNFEGSEEWAGIDTDRNKAIMKYLMNRLGVKL